MHTEALRDERERQGEEKKTSQAIPILGGHNPTEKANATKKTGVTEGRGKKKLNSRE